MCVRRRWSRGRHFCRGRCSGHALEYKRANHLLASTSLILMGTTCTRRSLFLSIYTYYSYVLAALGGRLRAIADREEEWEQLADNSGGGYLQFVANGLCIFFLLIDRSINNAADWLAGLVGRENNIHRVKFEPCVAGYRFNHEYFH